MSHSAGRPRSRQLHAIGPVRSRSERPRGRHTTQNTEKFPPPHVRPGSGGCILSAQTSTLVEAEITFATAT